MKTKIELIKNYPVESLKNWGDYFGYPENICKKMTDMLGTTDWQNAKIAVLDDFGFQMTNFLINAKKVPLQNIHFLVSESDEAKVELMKKWYSNFLENTVSSIYNINMSFDLIIANPPYGLNNSIAKKIIPVLLEKAKDAVVLVPKNTYKDKTCLEHMKSINIVDNVFEDASVQNLSISLLSKDWENIDITVESVSLSSKQMKLATAIREYNKTHSKPYNRLKFSGTPIGNKMEKTVKEAALEGICEHLKPIADMKLKDARDSNLFFVLTVWTPSNGVHANHAHDWTYNLEGKWDPDWNRMCPVNAFVFLNKQERDNFSKWWYSCLEGVQGKKLRVGLTNACLDLIRDAISSSGGYYETYFPNLDWSRPWTDQEILKELGLPEDFLEKEE